MSICNLQRSKLLLVNLFNDLEDLISDVKQNYISVPSPHGESKCKTCLPGNNTRNENSLCLTHKFHFLRASTRKIARALCFVLFLCPFLRSQGVSLELLLRLPFSRTKMSQREVNKWPFIIRYSSLLSHCRKIPFSPFPF